MDKHLIRARVNGIIRGLPKKIEQAYKNGAHYVVIYKANVQIAPWDPVGDYEYGLAYHKNEMQYFTTWAESLGFETKVVREGGRGSHGYQNYYEEFRFSWEGLKLKYRKNKLEKIVELASKKFEFKEIKDAQVSEELKEKLYRWEKRMKRMRSRSW